MFYCMKYEIEQMLGNGGGAIVNCSSVLGLNGFPSDYGTYSIHIGEPQANSLSACCTRT